MWGASVCSCLSDLTSAIIYFHILRKTNNVASGDFHRSSAPSMIFQCTLSKLKHFNRVTAEHLGTLSPYATTPPLWLSLAWLVFSPSFVRILMIALQFVFVMSLISWRYTYSWGAPVQKKDCTDMFFLEYKFKRISCTMIPKLLRLAQNIYLVLRIYWLPI